MQERLNWLPWKGSGLVRVPRVRIPLIPPMNTEVKEILGKVIIETENRINQIFNVIQSDPNSLENDEVFIMLLDQLGNNLEEYNK